MGHLMVFPPSYHAPRFSAAEEAAHEAAEALRDALVDVCTSPGGPCRVCVGCRAVLRDYAEAAEAHEDARIAAYEHSVLGGV